MKKSVGLAVSSQRAVDVHVEIFFVFAGNFACVNYVQREKENEAIRELSPLVEVERGKSEESTATSHLARTTCRWLKAER